MCLVVAKLVSGKKIVPKIYVFFCYCMQKNEGKKIVYLKKKIDVVKENTDKYVERKSLH